MLVSGCGDELDESNQNHIGDDNEEGGIDDAASGGAADAFGAAAGRHAAVAARHGDQKPEDDRFQDGRHDVFQAQSAQAGVAIFSPGHGSAQPFREESSGDGQAGDLHGQKGQSRHAGQDPRADQRAYRRRPQDFQGVDLFGEAHGAELGAETGAGSAGDDQTRPHRRQLQDHGQGQRLGQQLDVARTKTDQDAVQVHPNDAAQGQTANDADGQGADVNLIKLLQHISRPANGENGGRQRSGGEMD